MAANFLHGVETIEITSGGRAVKLVKSSVIGLVGTAPIFQAAEADRFINHPVQILSDVDAAKYFGSATEGYTIPAALDAIRDCGRGVALVVNVFDPAVHKTYQAPATRNFGSDGKISLGCTGVSALAVRNPGGVPYVAGTDYDLDPAKGVITRRATGAIAASAAVTVEFYYADPTKVTPADIIGGINAAGNRTGLQGFADCYNLYGYFPKNLIAPVYSTQNAVAVELIAMATRLRGHALIDAPIGATVAQAIAGRGPMGSINFNTSSPRAILCFPHARRYDTATNAEVLEPLSQRAAGVMAETDIAEGYWVSPSNHEIAGIIGMERRISAMINDPNSEANLLNEAGVVTLFNSFGSGIRLWGNRSAAWPSSAHATNFISIRRTLDIIHESVEYAMLQFIDGPLDLARIDSILATVNGLVRKLIADGALVDGRYWFKPEDNTVEELAAGHLTLRNDLTPPSPLERISFKSRYSTEGLAKLYKAAE